MSRGSGGIIGPLTSSSILGAGGIWSITAAQQNHGNSIWPYASAAFVEYLSVAGGGGGGGRYQSGGGGAGGVIQGSSFVLRKGQTCTITIGAGGAGGARGSDGAPGDNTVISNGANITITAYGGGSGSASGYGGNGGSGGGSSKSTIDRGGYGVYPGSLYIDEPRQGYDGGHGNNGGSIGAAGGGGGGAGGPGGTGASGVVVGGIGITSTISGISKNYAGGGGCGVYFARGGLAYPGFGGGDGGGNTSGQTNGAPGTANTGGGGGGTERDGTGAGGAGGSGVVILRTLSTAASTTGSPTVTTDGSYNIYTFTGSGSISF